MAFVGSGRRGRWTLGGVVLSIGVATATPALAQQPTPDQARARTVAAQGRAAYDRGDLAKGCPLLEEAFRLDGQLLGAGFALAECREKEGKLATAHRIFLEIADKAQARGEERAGEARTRAAGLAPRLSQLKLDVSSAAAQRQDLVVEVDGQPWPRATWGAPTPVDGGAHTIVARAGGVDPWSTTIDVAVEGASVGVAVPFDRTEAKAADPVAPPLAAEAGEPFPWKTAGLVTGGVGVALLGTGIVLGVVAKGDYDSVESDCDANNECTSSAAATRNDARSLAGVGTVLFVGGAILAAAGVTVFIVGPEGESADSAALRVSPGAVEMTGRF